MYLYLNTRYDPADDTIIDREVANPFRILSAYFMVAATRTPLTGRNFSVKTSLKWLAVAMPLPETSERQRQERDWQKTRETSKRQERDKREKRERQERGKRE